MNKEDLVNAAAKVTGTKKETQAAASCVLDLITKDVEEEGRGDADRVWDFQSRQEKSRDS
jgi:hypothetical protein